MKFKGKIKKIFKQTDSWICMKFEQQQPKVQYTAKGNFTGFLIPEMNIIIEGDFVIDKTYGKQIEIREIETESSVAAGFLAKRVKGVGAKLANDIVETLGEDCIGKIIENPEVLYKVKGIKKKKFAMIASSIKENKNLDLTMDILSYFNNDITEFQIDKIIGACEKGKKTFKQIKENPYWLIEHIEGFGFKKVDKLARAAGVEEFSKERTRAAIAYSLQQMSNSKGHVYSDMQMLCIEAAELLLGYPAGYSKRVINSLRGYIDEEQEEEIHELLKKQDKDGTLKKWKENYETLLDVMADVLADEMEKPEEEKLIIVEEERIYWSYLYHAEVKSAKIIADIGWKVSTKPIEKKSIARAIHKLEEEEECAFSEEQKLAVYTSLEHRISIITGGPGRGKTTILKAIMRAWNDDKNLVLLAPTGRAAKRMAEATGHPASTIHRYRGMKKENETMRNKLVIVDETSMIGILLGYSLLSMVKDANIILVGDVDQLASVEPGCFMKDMIDSSAIAVSWLTKGFRNGGSIAKNADRINHGKGLKYLEQDADTVFLKSEPENIEAGIINFYKNARKHYSPSEIGILSPMKVRGEGCVESINRAIREHFNPATLANPNNESGFRIHDRVMHIKNDYNKVLTAEDWTQVKGVFNGDLGEVISHNEDTEQLKILFDDGSTGYFSYSEMKNNFILAYATTIHKAQGSEYKAVSVVLNKQHAFALNRKLFYTAVTRAKEFLFIIGQEDAYYLTVKNNDDAKRNSGLKDRIKEYAIAKTD